MPDGSAVFFEFSEKEDLTVRILFTHNLDGADDLDMRKPVFIDGVDQMEDGSMLARDLKKWFEATLSRWETDLFDSMPLEEKCS